MDKPCPFCGGTNTYMDSVMIDDIHPYYFRVCNGCECEGPTAETEQEAADKWNNLRA